MAEVTQEMILDYLVKKGGLVKNVDLVRHFKKYLQKETSQEKDRARVVFKERVNKVAFIKADKQDKYLHLRGEFYPPGGLTRPPTGRALQGSNDHSSVSSLEDGGMTRGDSRFSLASEMTTAKSPGLESELTFSPPPSATLSPLSPTNRTSSATPTSTTSSMDSGMASTSKKLKGLEEDDFGSSLMAELSSFGSLLDSFGMSGKTSSAGKPGPSSLLNSSVSTAGSSGHAPASTSATSSTSRYSHGHAPSSTSSYSTGHVPSSTSGYSTGHTPSSTSSYSPGHAPSPTSSYSPGHAPSSTSGYSPGHAPQNSYSNSRTGMNSAPQSNTNPQRSAASSSLAQTSRSSASPQSSSTNSPQRSSAQSTPQRAGYAASPYSSASSTPQKTPPASNTPVKKQSGYGQSDMDFDLTSVLSGLPSAKPAAKQSGNNKKLNSDSMDLSDVLSSLPSAKSGKRTTPGDSGGLKTGGSALASSQGGIKAGNALASGQLYDEPVKSARNALASSSQQGGIKAGNALGSSQQGGIKAGNALASGQLYDEPVKSGIKSRNALASSSQQGGIKAGNALGSSQQGGIKAGNALASGQQYEEPVKSAHQNSTKAGQASYQNSTRFDQPKAGQTSYQNSTRFDQPQTGQTSYQNSTRFDQPQAGQTSYQNSTRFDQPKAGQNSYQNSSKFDQPQAGYQNSTRFDQPKAGQTSYQNSTRFDQPKAGQTSYQNSSKFDQPQAGQTSYQNSSKFDQPQAGYQNSTRLDQPKAGQTSYQNSSKFDQPKAGQTSSTRFDQPKASYQNSSKFDQPQDGRIYEILEDPKTRPQNSSQPPQQVGERVYNVLEAPKPAHQSGYQNNARFEQPHDAGDRVYHVLDGPKSSQTSSTRFDQAKAPAGPQPVYGNGPTPNQSTSQMENLPSQQHSVHRPAPLAPQRTSSISRGARDPGSRGAVQDPYKSANGHRAAPPPPTQAPPKTSSHSTVVFSPKQAPSPSPFQSDLGGFDLGDFSSSMFSSIGGSTVSPAPSPAPSSVPTSAPGGGKAASSQGTSLDTVQTSPPSTRKLGPSVSIPLMGAGAGGRGGPHRRQGSGGDASSRKQGSIDSNTPGTPSIKIEGPGLGNGSGSPSRRGKSPPYLPRTGSVSSRTGSVSSGTGALGVQLRNKEGKRSAASVSRRSKNMDKSANLDNFTRLSISMTPPSSRKHHPPDVAPKPMRSASPSSFQDELEEGQQQGGFVDPEDSEYDYEEIDPLEKEWMLASAQADIDGLQRLMMTDSSLLNRKGFLHGYTALHWAAKHGRMDILSMLLLQGAITDTKSTGGLTPLHLAAQAGHDNILEVLVSQHNANVNVRENGGRRAIDMLNNRASERIKSLLSHLHNHGLPIKVENRLLPATFSRSRETKSSLDRNWKSLGELAHHTAALEKDKGSKKHKLSPRSAIKKSFSFKRNKIKESVPASPKRQTRKGARPMSDAAGHRYNV